MTDLKNRLHEIVGPENFTDKIKDLEQYSQDESIFSGVLPSFIVRPSSADEIREIIRLANKEKIPLIPVSSEIHFNGITLPSQGGGIIDLAGMNRIIEVDIRNRRAMIEPGVQWGQLQDHLRSMDMVAMNPMFPHPGQSVVTSCLERQPLLIPKFEYAEPISTLEVVLPTGDLLRTGSAASPGAPFDTVADMVCPYGPGIDFYRLFQGAQGTLGAVTWVNVKIEYFSTLRKTWFIQSTHLPDLLAFVHQVQRLMIGNECFILKKPDMAAIASAGDRKKAENLMGELKEWTAVLQIAGSRRRPEARIAYQENAFQKLCSEYNITAYASLSGSTEESALLKDSLQQPWPEDRTFWKYLYKGNCHNISFHTTGNRLPRIVEEVGTFLAEKNIHENDFGVYIQPLENGRAYCCHYHLYYNPDEQKQKEIMVELDKEINHRLFMAGTLFNTPSENQSLLTYSHDTINTETLKKVKDIFDPNSIMNPGRLCF